MNDLALCCTHVNPRIYEAETGDTLRVQGLPALVRETIYLKNIIKGKSIDWHG